MCLSPNWINGRLVACRHCDICRNNRLDDLTGRCLAEQATSDATYAVTLTYAEDTPSTAVLCYRDVQLALKRIRMDGYKVRYICAGEYGATKGRAHWHIALFFKGKKPDIEIGQRISWKYWPHGFSYFQTAESGGFRYLMKYALKDTASEYATRRLAMSKKPPLGYEFFMRLADDMVERRISIRSPEYAFSHVRDRFGRARRYWLQGRTRELWIERYLDGWRKRWNEEAPETEWLARVYLDPIARAENEASPDYRALSARERIYWNGIQANGIAAPGVEPFVQPEGCGVLFLDRRGRDHIYLYENNTAQAYIGNQSWPILRHDAAARLARAGLSGRALQRALTGMESLWQSADLLRLKRESASSRSLNAGAGSPTLPPLSPP